MPANATRDTLLPVLPIAPTGEETERVLPREDEQFEIQEGFWSVGVRVSILAGLWMLLALACFPIVTTGRNPIRTIQVAIFKPHVLDDFQPRLPRDADVSMLVAPLTIPLSCLPATLLVLATGQWITNRRHFKLLLVVTLVWHCLLTQLLSLMFGYVFNSQAKDFTFSGGAISGPISFPTMLAYSGTAFLGLVFHEQQLASLPGEALGRFRKPASHTPVLASRVRWAAVGACTLGSWLLMPLDGPATLLLQMRAWIQLETELRPSLINMARHATHGVGGYPLLSILCAALPAILALYYQRHALRYSRTPGHTLGTLAGWMAGIVGMWLVALSLLSFTHQMQGIRQNWIVVHETVIWVVFAFLCAGYAACSTMALTRDLPPACRAKCRQS